MTDNQSGQSNDGISESELSPDEDPEIMKQRGMNEQ